jgi:hypothetical protein
MAKAEELLANLKAKMEACSEYREVGDAKCLKVLAHMTLGKR